MFYNIYSCFFECSFYFKLFCGNYIHTVSFIFFLNSSLCIWNVFVVLQYYCSRLAFLLTVMSKALSGAVLWISFSICKCILYIIFQQWKKYLVFSVYTVILTGGSFKLFFSVLDWWLNHFHIAHRSDVKSENIYLPIQFILINGQKVRVEGMYVKRINVFAF